MRLPHNGGTGSVWQHIQRKRIAGNIYRKYAMKIAFGRKKHAIGTRGEKHTEERLRRRKRRPHMRRSQNTQRGVLQNSVCTRKIKWRRTRRKAKELSADLPANRYPRNARYAKNRWGSSLIGGNLPIGRLWGKEKRLRLNCGREKPPKAARNKTAASLLFDKRALPQFDLEL